MKLIESLKQGWKEEVIPSFKTRNSRSGSYSIAMTAVVLAIIIVINVMVSLLPSSWTQLDISSSQLYSITSNTKVVLNNLDTDVTIYWVVQSGEEDTILEKLLDKYDASEHVEVVVKNPDIYPTFAQQYTSDTVENNSLIVESGSRYRYISYDEIYEYSSSYYSTYVTGFDGEGAITSAIDYVVNEDLPLMYILTGHGESELSSSFSSGISKSNVETQSLSLLTCDQVPEDADLVLIYSPQSDISENEAEMLRTYMDGGGKLLVLSGPLDGITLDNLNSLLADYSITVEEGIVVETDRSYYAFSMPYVLLPEIESHDITDVLVDEGYYAILPIAGGLTIGDYSGSAEITSLLSTSGNAFSKIAGYSLSTYDEEEGDIDGPFSLAVAIERTSGGKMVWISSGYILDETYNSYSSGANLDLVLNSVSWMAGESDGISIRSKSLTYEYLTISDSQASVIKTVIIGVIPALFLLAGVIVVIRRRRRA